MLCERTTEAYNYDGIEFAIVAVPSNSYHFEAEVMADEDNVAATKAHIQEVCEKLDPKIFTDEEYIAYIETLNKEANEVFDFENYTENYFENRYHFSKEKATHQASPLDSRRLFAFSMMSTDDRFSVNDYCL